MLWNINIIEIIVPLLSWLVFVICDFNKNCLLWRARGLLAGGRCSVSIRDSSASHPINTSVVLTLPAINNKLPVGRFTKPCGLPCVTIVQLFSTVLWKYIIVTKWENLAIASPFFDSRTDLKRSITSASLLLLQPTTM